MSDNYHFIGIGGIGMSGLARLLLSQQVTVTGSDLAFNAVIEGLIREGAVIHKGHAAEHITPDAKVVYTSDIKADNPEYQAAIKRQCSLLHRSDLLAKLLEGQKSLAVAGTHGKTTTASLLTTVLINAYLDPSFAIGGMLLAFQTNARLGKGDYFAFEADESDRSFLKYHPFGAIITNIDNDHLNNFEGSLTVLVESFKQFMAQVGSSQHLFWCQDDVYLTQLNVPGQRYGFHPASDWKIVSVRQEGFQMFFDLEHQGHLYEQIELALIGRHNVLNAAAVFGLSLILGVPEASVRQTFKTFKGISRRCENKGTFHDVLFLDDYAHHPTEIQTTLEGIQQAIGSKRLIAVFQPHRYSRTQDCLGQYGAIFDSADELLITDIYGAGETPIAHLSHALILKEIQQNSTISCRYIPRSALSHYLSQFVQPNDVVVTLGAGDITKLPSETLSLLEKHPPRHLKVGWIWDSQAVDQTNENVQS
jgi:UDP-N-acetylmuramate--alanine ligase